MTTTSLSEKGATAVAKEHNIPVSPKHCLEISKSIRYRTTQYAKRFLQEVADEKRAVPFVRFRRNVGHKRGMASGRFPQKAAHAFLKLMKAVEANAQVKGLDTAELKIIRLVVNRGAIPRTGARHGYGTHRRTHLEVEVRQKGGKGAKKTDVSVVGKEAAAAVKASPTVHVPIADVPIVDVPTKAVDVPIADVPRKKAEVSVAVKEAAAVQPKDVIQGTKATKELSSADLLKQAQARAAELNKKEKTNKEVAQVNNLYDELQKKGTLRGSGLRSTKQTGVNKP